MIQHQIPFKEGSIVYLQPNKSLTQKYNKDIIDGVYEGGFQLWQCETDLLQYLNKSQINFTSKTVIEIGCGHGLLGIAAIKIGAQKVCFHDYNEDVLKQITLATLQANFDQTVINNKCRLEWGDWQNWQSNQKFDIIIASQVIYNEKNYSKLSKLIKKVLKPDGSCIMANKHYYFGVGGNMPSFKQHLDSQSLKWETLQKIAPKTGGNKRQIIQIKM